MRFTKPIESSGTIGGIIAQKYRSMIIFIVILLAGLWVTLSAYALNNLYREVMDRMYSWVLINKTRIEEAVFLNNYASLGLRLSHVSTLSDTITHYEMSLYDPSGKIVLGTLPLPETKRWGFGYSIRGLAVDYVDSLSFGGKNVGYLYIRSQLKPQVLVVTSLLIFILCLLIFLAMRRLLTSFLIMLDQRIVEPIVGLRESMNRFDLSKGVSDATLQVPPASEIAELYQGYDSLLARIRDYSELEVKRAESDAAYRIAAQVAHDIRSPLAALRSTSGSVSQLPEDSRNLIRMAITRINDIAANLTETNRVRSETDIDSSGGSSPTTSNELLISLIEDIISEKRSQLQEQESPELRFDPGPTAYGLFAHLDPREFKRLLSNLLNNSVEAITKNSGGLIEVTLDPVGDSIEIRIRDNGKGIPSHILPQLAQRGFSYEKKGGTGLGLSHGRETMQRWSGALHIESEFGKGTLVRLILPRSVHPAWFLAEIPLRPGQTVIVVDDDPSIHKLWQNRFDRLTTPSLSLTLVHLYGPKEVADWISKNQPLVDEALFLVDYEFHGADMNGIGIIQSNRIEKQSVLVTARHDEFNVRTECLRLQVALLPKRLASMVPITVQP